MNENLSQMLVIAVMGIFMVFAVLSILWAVIEIMHFLIGLAEKKKNKKDYLIELIHVCLMYYNISSYILFLLYFFKPAKKLQVCVIEFFQSGR